MLWQQPYFSRVFWSWQTGIWLSNIATLWAALLLLPFLPLLPKDRLLGGLGTLGLFTLELLSFGGEFGLWLFPLDPPPIFSLLGRITGAFAVPYFLACSNLKWLASDFNVMEVKLELSSLKVGPLLSADFWSPSENINKNVNKRQYAYASNSYLFKCYYNNSSGGLKFVQEQDC